MLVRFGLKNLFASRSRREGLKRFAAYVAPGPEMIGASGRLEQDDVIGHLWRMRRRRLVRTESMTSPLQRWLLAAGPFEPFRSFARERVMSSTQRVEMSNRSQAALQSKNGHYSTLHAFFLAAKESECTEFELQLVSSPKGRIEFCICPRGHSEMSAKFDVRGNTVRVAVSDASVVPVDDSDVRIDYGGTRSGEEPVRVSPGARSSPPRRPATVTCRDPQKMDWSL